MRKYILILALLTTSGFLFPTFIKAHSGRTDSSGGHNCNVGSCAGTYHYHSGGPAPAPAYVAPKKKVIPTIKPATTRPTVRRTTTPTPVVKGESTDDNASTVLGLGAIGLLGYLYWKSKKK